MRWYICYNTVQNPDKTGHGWQVAGQDSKVFKDKAALDKYLQGRIAAYAHLFQEISPPVPQGEVGRFSVHGVLLPGYTVEAPEQTPKEAADALLALLGDEDMPLPDPREPEAPPARSDPKRARLTGPRSTSRYGDSGACAAVTVGMEIAAQNISASNMLRYVV